MAYVGLAYPIIAKYTENEDQIPTYADAVILGKAVQVEITPVYEDISAYQDMNDTDYERELCYADLRLTVSHLSASAAEYWGESAPGTSSEYDQTLPVGLGFYRQSVVSGRKSYSALWLYKVKLWEGESTHETKGDSINYVTPSLSGRAFPAENGIWRQMQTFEEKAAAIAWLLEMAGQKGE